MGQVRTAECERIDRELAAICGTGVEIETQKDTYSEDYIIWVTVHDVVQPIRITIDEYREEDWKGNVRRAIEELSAQAASGEDAGS